MLPLGDDDDDTAFPALSPKRRRIAKPIAIERFEEIFNTNVRQMADFGKNEELDWLSPPPKVSRNAQRTVVEDSTLKELRLKKKELESFAQSAEDVLPVEESVELQLGSSMQSSLEAVADQPSKPTCERIKIVISIQDKDGAKQFRIYTDDKFERLFKMYADIVKLDIQNLVFSFDGDKINPASTPDGLGMEENDIIEVHVKSS
ncbi:hypothetical protein ACB092_08G194000 [Castanea dentata]